MRIRNVKNAKELLQKSDYYIDTPEDNLNRWKSVFKNDFPIMLEIGMGKGDFIIGMAKLHPELNFIGVESEESVLVRAVQKLENADLKNVFVINRNALNLNEVFDHEIDTIYLNFSDPWPKTRHHKRRLTYKTFLEVYDKLFKSEAKIIMKTDNDGLFEDSIVYLSSYGYTLDKITLDLWKTEEENIRTEYEIKFGGKGLKIKRLVAHKNISRQKR